MTWPTPWLLQLLCPGRVPPGPWATAVLREPLSLCPGIWAVLLGVGALLRALLTLRQARGGWGAVGCLLSVRANAHGTPRAPQAAGVKGMVSFVVLSVRALARCVCQHLKLAPEPASRPWSCVTRTQVTGPLGRDSEPLVFGSPLRCGQHMHQKGEQFLSPGSCKKPGASANPQPPRREVLQARSPASGVSQTSLSLCPSCKSHLGGPPSCLEQGGWDGDCGGQGWPDPESKFRQCARDGGTQPRPLGDRGV